MRLTQKNLHVMAHAYDRLIFEGHEHPDAECKLARAYGLSDKQVAKVVEYHQEVAENDLDNDDWTSGPFSHEAQ